MTAAPLTLRFSGLSGAAPFAMRYGHKITEGSGTMKPPFMWLCSGTLPFSSSARAALIKPAV